MPYAGVPAAVSNACALLPLPGSQALWFFVPLHCTFSCAGPARHAPSLCAIPEQADLDDVEGLVRALLTEVELQAGGEALELQARVDQLAME